jgi:transcription elongation factor Elf1
MNGDKDSVEIAGLSFNYDEITHCPDCGAEAVSVVMLDDESERIQSSCDECDYVETTEIVF